VAFFEWKDEYSTGLDGIDGQHRIIVRLMNELYEAILAGRDREIMKRVYVDLLKYANYHFCLELQLFQRYRYAEERRHIEEHNSFIRKVESLLINDLVAEKNRSLDTLHFLRSWFADHMMKTDMEYCRFFQRKELMDEIEEYLRREDEKASCN